MPSRNNFSGEICAIEDSGIFTEKLFRFAEMFGKRDACRAIIEELFSPADVSQVEAPRRIAPPRELQKPKEKV